MNHYKSQYDLTKQKIIMIMAGLMVGLLVAALDNSIISTAMPKIIGNLQGMEYYVWPFTSYMLTSTISIILFGKLSDIYGRTGHNRWNHHICYNLHYVWFCN